MTKSVAPWLDAPLSEFVRQARVDLAVALEPSGRVLAQHGFTRSLDVMAVCSLVVGSYWLRTAVPDGQRASTDTAQSIHWPSAASGLLFAGVAYSVLTQVDVRRHAKRGYGESVQYYSKYEAYYK